MHGTLGKPLQHVSKQTQAPAHPSGQLQGSAGPTPQCCAMHTAVTLLLARHSPEVGAEQLLILVCHYRQAHV